MTEPGCSCAGHHICDNCYNEPLVPACYWCRREGLDHDSTCDERCAKSVMVEIGEYERCPNAVPCADHKPRKEPCPDCDGYTRCENEYHGRAAQPKVNIEKMAREITIGFYDWLDKNFEALAPEIAAIIRKHIEGGKES